MEKKLTLLKICPMSHESCFQKECTIACQEKWIRVAQELQTIDLFDEEGKDNV